MIKQRFRFTIYLLILLAVRAALPADEECSSEPAEEIVPCCYPQPLVEAKAGYFFFTNSKMHKAYNNGGVDIQLCCTYPLWNLTDCWTINAYGALEYFQQSGRSINGHQKTSLWSVPINIGLKPVYTVNEDTQYYFALGPRYFFIHQHNSSPYVYKNRSRNGVGLFANAGVNYSLCDRLVIDIFGEYSYAKVHFHGSSRVYTKSMPIGGFTFGGGAGYIF